MSSPQAAPANVVTGQAPTLPPQRIALGIALRVSAMLLIAIMQALIKWCSERGISTSQIMLFRNLFGFIPLLIYISMFTGWAAIATRRPMAHATRSAIGLVSTACGFSALHYLPLTEAAAFSFATPLVMTALSSVILKEKIGLHRGAAVVVGFLGVLIMIKPMPGHFNAVGVGFAVGGVIAAAATYVTIRQMGATEKSAAIVFYFTLAGAIAGAVGSALHWTQPDPATLGLLIAMGIVGGVGQILLTEALRCAPVAVIAPFDYTQLAWATGLGALFWADLPSLSTLAGAGVIAASGSYILYRELKRADQT